MIKTVKDKWTAALLSGEYEQGRYALRNGDERGVTRHCCLGVLCELARAEGVVSATDVKFVKADGSETDSFETRYGAHQQSAYLPEEVVKWAGLGDHLGGLPNPTPNGRTLSQLNDTGGFTFTDIAEVIQEQF